ncbi:hypothetical protein, partial [Mesorhizobium sp.]|uniref:hypothetical protein n=1 Tax=Mesorhizobium sp. TaxID=1871066 RepID=UPI0025BCB0D5
GLGVWHASVDPVGFGFQIFSVYLGMVLAGRCRLVDEKEPKYLRIAKEGGTLSIKDWVTPSPSLSQTIAFMPSGSSLTCSTV